MFHISQTLYSNNLFVYITSNYIIITNLGPLYTLTWKTHFKILFYQFK